MEFKSAEKIIESFKKRPKRTLFILIILFILVIVWALVNGYFSEKGRQIASSSKESTTIIPPSKEIQNKSKDINAPAITQRTEGDQSPAIVSDKVNIQYGVSKEKKTKE